MGAELITSTVPKWLEDFASQWPELFGAKLEYMPLYISDFLADDNVGEMNTLQRGAYLMLLMRGWQQSPPASIPDNDSTLAKWAGISRAKWTAIRDIVLKPFTPGPDGRLYQKRMAEEWLAASRLYWKKKAGADATNAKKKQHAERDDSATHSVTPSARITRPDQPDHTPIKPPQPPNPDATRTAADGGNGVQVVGGDWSAEAAGRELLSASRVNIDLDSRGRQAKACLKTLGVGNSAQNELSARPEITVDLIRKFVGDLNRSGSVKDLPGCLVSKLREYRR